MYNNIKSFLHLLKKHNLDGFIVTNPVNIFYLTGFKGVMPQEREALLIVTVYPTKPWRSGATLVTAKLYQSEAMRVASKHLRIKIATERNQMQTIAKKLLSQTHLRGKVQVTPREHLGDGRIGFEENDLKFAEYQELKKFSTGSNNKRAYSSRYRSNNNYLIPCKDLIEKMRLIKTEDEIKKIEKAQIISQKAFEVLVKTIKIGQTEEEIAQNLASIIKNLGGQGLAFESIVASGPNSGKPHHVTSNKRLTKNDILLFDFGTKYQDYCADLSRTIFIGKAPATHRNIYLHVHRAQKSVLDKITHGLKAQEAYHIVNNHFKKLRLDRYFLHGLGHGIGLEVHEKPHLRPGGRGFGGRAHLRPTQARLGQGRQAGLGVPGQKEEVLTENMVFSVEPGLYFPWGGVRIEDLVVIQNGQAKVLGKLTEEIIEI